MAPRPRVAPERREHIVQATIRCLAREGYAGLQETRPGNGRRVLLSHQRSVFHSERRLRRRNPSSEGLRGGLPRPPRGT